MLQASVESGYARFLALVGKARSRTPAQVDQIAQGRVWDGGTARQLGLVDQFGGLDAALADAAARARLKAGEWHPVFLADGTDPLHRILRRWEQDASGGRLAGGGHDFAALVAGRQDGAAGRVLADARRLLGTRGVQAYCLECAAAMPARTAQPVAESLPGPAVRLLGQLLH